MHRWAPESRGHIFGGQQLQARRPQQHHNWLCLVLLWTCGVQVHKLPTLFFVGPDSSKPAAQYTGLLPEAVMRDMVQTRRQYLGTDIRKALSI